MHELGLCQAIVDAVEQGAHGRQVLRVRIRVGAQHRCSPEEFEHAFALIAEGTVAAGATVDMVVTPARVICESCGFDGENGSVIGLCPRCGSPSVDIHGGDELTVESMQLAPTSNVGAQ